MKYIKKYWFIILIIILTIIRFFMSYDLPIYYLNMGYDDLLMIKQANTLLNGEYLGYYHSLTLVKGIVYPLFLMLVRLFNMNYSIILTNLYIFSCIFFTLSLKHLFKNRKLLGFIYIILLFNPLSYSSELFQRIYRSSISIIELLFFFSFIIRIISNNKKNILNYIMLGFITSLLLMTREDNIWIYIILFILFVYKIYKNIKIKNIIINLIPILIIILNLNIVSFVNYNYYGIYTYNELSNSYFKDTYIKILMIKDYEKDNVFPISRSTLYKLCEKSKVFSFTKEEITLEYDKLLSDLKFDKGTFFWYFRTIFHIKNQFKSGYESEMYFKELSLEIEELFKNGELEKEFSIPSILINTPTIEELKKIPRNFLEAIIYSSTYKDVKTFSLEDIENLEEVNYNQNMNAYSITYPDYHHSDNMIDENIKSYEIIRIIYKYFTIIFSIISLVIFIKNIKVKDKLNLINILVFITYLIILAGVVYSDTTAFHAIRYFYLVNVYILQSIFILLNLGRVYEKRN